MKKTSAKPAAKKRETKNKTLSNVVKPENMGLREWQIRLRKQAAVKDAVSTAAPAWISGHRGCPPANIWRLSRRAR